MNKSVKNYIVFAILISILIAPSFVLAAWWNPFSWGFWGNIWNSIFNRQSQPVACTMEAKICPDGSAVGRTGSNCEFAPCPTSQDEIASWKTYTNTQYGFEVSYPSGWKISDTSSTNAGTKYPAVSIESPLRSNLEGYQGIPVSYRILIYMPDGAVTSIADFGSNQKPAQSWWNIEVSKATKEVTEEYKTGQQIISTFKFTK